MTPTSYGARLTQARRLLARGASPLPLQEADQLHSAAHDAHTFQQRLAAALTTTAPRRGWQSATLQQETDEPTVRLVAAALACRPCHHIRPPAGPRPVVVTLPLRRVDCHPCVGRGSKQPQTADDQCDVCEVRGVVRFVPFACTLGPATIGGDACPDCAAVLGIDQAA